MVTKSMLMEDNLGVLLGDTARLIRRDFDVRARDIGVTRPQWRVLLTLRRHEGINQGGLAEILEVEPITVCRMVDRLQEGGLVERRADPSDRRSWRLFLTPRAEKLVDQLKPLAEEMLEAALDGVSGRERASLFETLDRIRQNLSRRSNEQMTANG